MPMTVFRGQQSPSLPPAQGLKRVCLALPAASEPTPGDGVRAAHRRYSGLCYRLLLDMQRSEKTQSAYEIDLAQLQTHVGASTPLVSIGDDCLERSATAMQSDGYAAVSIRRKFATARVFFTYWVRKGVIDKSPLWRIRLDLGRERLLPRSLSPQDAKRLMEEAWRRLPSAPKTQPYPASPYFLRLRNIAALEILFATGMRVGELVSLTLADWHTEDNVFSVRGKGSRQR